MLETGNTIKADGRKYTVIKALGNGANTAAYLAECDNGKYVYKCILKEYCPQDTDDFEAGKNRFIEAAKMQNNIRQKMCLTNQTPPIVNIFEANNMVYSEVACYNGDTLVKLTDMTLLQYMEICRTIAQTVGYYHAAGYICLDLKPENIFIMQNTPDDTITQLVEFIDFDSIRNITGSTVNTPFSYTRAWAAPEQMNPYSIGKIDKRANIYTVGEIVFYLLFGRHSKDEEHRGFSKYPFDECKREYCKFVSRPDIRNQFAGLFRGTLRSSPWNRFQAVSNVVDLLDKLISEISRKDYIIPRFPAVSPNFTGRKNELRCISESLMTNHVLYVTGVGGIGKSSLVRKYIESSRTKYDVIVYLDYDCDIVRTFADDKQLMISTVSRYCGEDINEYFDRKLNYFNSICAEKHVLIVVDNFTGKITKEFSRIIDCGYDTMIVSRKSPPKNSFASIEIGAIENESGLFGLISMNLERQLTREEKISFGEIIKLVHGHTLVIELIARQIASGNLNIRKALELIRENGFSHFSDEKIGNYKDGEEVYDTLSAIISALFTAGNISDELRNALKTFALMDHRGIEKFLAQKFFPDISDDTVNVLEHEGWLYADERIRVHPVIAETVRNWNWTADDIAVMEQHKKVTDIYTGMANAEQIAVILREAKKFRTEHPRHIINALYYDILGWYYDTLIGGVYDPVTDEEIEMSRKQDNAIRAAINELKRSSDVHREKYLVKYYLDLASIQIRLTIGNKKEASALLKKIKLLLKNERSHISENFCYYYMVLAWYHTNVERNLKKSENCTKKAEAIAWKIFRTDLEIIDIIYIPTADCLANHHELRASADKLSEAVDICNKYPGVIPYVDKKAELLCCMLDVYFEMDEFDICWKLISEIDRINDEYADQGVHRGINPGLLKIMNM